jgi:hypothetical protein
MHQLDQGFVTEISDVQYSFCKKGADIGFPCDCAVFWPTLGQRKEQEDGTTNLFACRHQAKRGAESTHFC